MSNNLFIPEDAYQTILQLIPIPCVDVLIHQDKRILLVKRREEPKKDYWWFVGGRVNKNETLVETAIRKAKEEAGLDIVVEKIIGTYDGIYEFCHTVNTVILAKVIGDFRVVLDNTSGAYKIIESIDEVYDPYIVKALKDSEVWK